MGLGLIACVLTHDKGRVLIVFAHTQKPVQKKDLGVFEISRLEKVGLPRKHELGAIRGNLSVQRSEGIGPVNIIKIQRIFGGSGADLSGI
jgi:hypothetical protein